MGRVSLVVIVAALSAVACGAAPAPPVVPSRDLPSSDGRVYALIDPSAKLTVVEFFSDHCPCQRVHDERLREIFSSYAPRGVAFRAVDSEVGARERLRAETEARRYPYPILDDEGGAVARALGAEFATYVVVARADGSLVYAGGIDSDKSHLTREATTYLRDALDDALASRPLRHRDTNPLGCALTLR